MNILSSLHIKGGSLSSIHHSSRKKHNTRGHNVSRREEEPHSYLSF